MIVSLYFWIIFNSNKKKVRFVPKCQLSQANARCGLALFADGRIYHGPESVFDELTSAFESI